MQVKNYPNCCTAKVIVGFGQTNTADHEIRPVNNELSVGEIKRLIDERLNSYSIQQMATLTCITNDQQVNANKALEELGFYSSDWMSKKQHSETKVKLWWFPINEKTING